MYNQDLFESYTALEYQLKHLREKVSQYETGERYLKLQDDFKKIKNGYIKEIDRLKKELEKARAETKNVRKLWTEAMESFQNEYQAKLDKKDKIIATLRQEIYELKNSNDEKTDKEVMAYEDIVLKLNEKIDTLQEELNHANALLGRDGTNTNIPTSQTPIGKKKRNPNSRTKSNKPKGGQVGHKKSSLEKPDEINEVVNHPLDDDATCPRCGSDNLEFTGEYECRYEIEIKTVVINREHRLYVYECKDCGKRIKSKIPPNLHTETQYGSNVQAMALSLMNTANVPINKVVSLLSGMTDSVIEPSQGYIAKLQSRASKGLRQFRKDLYKKLIDLDILYWDDTVVFANTKRICLRYYGNESIAYYVAHEKKDLKGVIEDDVLTVLKKDAKVMHDHNSINYNKQFKFVNLECCAHILRELQKCYDDTKHPYLLKIKNLIIKTIGDRKRLIESGIMSFDDDYLKNFNDTMKEYLKKGLEDAQKNKDRYTGPEERNVLLRLINYYDNFFSWVTDFELPTTNNLSERSLRSAKVKQRVSGQFDSVKTAGYYADVKTYIETCKRNGINEMIALKRLADGNPYTVSEIFEQRSDCTEAVC